MGRCAVHATGDVPEGVPGSRSDAETIRHEIAGVLSTIGLRLSEEKTLITHIEDGLENRSQSGAR